MMWCNISADANDIESIQVKLLCGSDLLESFAVPGLWSDEDVSYCCCITVFTVLCISFVEMALYIVT